MAAPSTSSPTHAPQLITLTWTSEEGRVESVRLWGFARTVTDCLWAAPRIDVEVLQTAVYGVQRGEPTNNFLRETGRKRRR